MRTIRIFERATRTCVLLAAGLLLCAGMDASAGDLPPAASMTAASNADAHFWSTLHGADYAAYPEALGAVEAAVAAAPGDAVQTAHAGWLHMWHLAEAGGFKSTPQEMSADLKAARQYFRRAVALAPAEARYRGFYATTLYFASAVASDVAGMRRADTAMAQAVRMWPEFNLFTAGYIHSGDPVDSPEYATALRRMWGDLDVCIGRRVSRTHPGTTQAPLDIQVGPKRACWNSSIAPHNLEGFFLNFGDMLVKQGDVVAAREMYANARMSKTYGEWAYRDVLEARIADAPANVAVFRDSSASADGAAQIMLQSDFACMACHRR